MPKTDTGVALAAFGNSNSSGDHGGKSSQQPHMAKNGKLFGICWTCGGTGHISRVCPSPPQPGGSPDKGKRKFEDSRSPSRSANAIAPFEEDGAWSTANLSDLFDDNLTDVSSVLSFGSSPDITWEHVPSYLSDTSVSVSNGSMPDLETVSDSSAATSMPDLRSVSDSDDNSVSDWFSEVEEDKLSDDLADDLSETSFEEIAAGIGEEDMEEVATIISEGFGPAGQVNLYNSGSTQHLLPYRDQFTTYQ